MRADSAYCEHKVFSQMNIPCELEMQCSALLLLLFNTKKNKKMFQTFISGMINHGVQHS